MDLTRLKELLEAQETFPHDYLLKFIGLNSPGFLNGVADLEERFPRLREKSARMSSGGANLALTYRFLADSADEIVELMEGVSRIHDLRVIL